MIYILASLIIALAFTILYLDNKSKSLIEIEELKGNINLEMTEKLNLESKYNNLLDDIKREESLKKSKDLDEMQMLFIKVNMLDEKITFLSLNIKNKLDSVLTTLESSIAKFDDMLKSQTANLINQNYDKNTSNDNSGANLSDISYTNIDNQDVKPLTVDEFCRNDFSSKSNIMEVADNLEQKQNIDISNTEEQTEKLETANESMSDLQVIDKNETALADETTLHNTDQNSNPFNKEHLLEESNNSNFIDDTLSAEQSVKSNITEEIQTNVDQRDITQQDIHEQQEFNIQNNELDNNLENIPDLENISNEIDSELTIQNSNIEALNLNVENTSADDLTKSFEDSSAFDIAILNEPESNNPAQNLVDNQDKNITNKDNEIDGDEELTMALSQLNNVSFETNDIVNQEHDRINASSKNTFESDNTNINDIENKNIVDDLQINDIDILDNPQDLDIENNGEITLEDSSGFDIKNSIDRLKAQLEEKK